MRCSRELADPRTRGHALASLAFQLLVRVFVSRDPLTVGDFRLFMTALNSAAPASPPSRA
jgi:hypothetical protein